MNVSQAAEEKAATSRDVHRLREDLLQVGLSSQIPNPYLGQCHFAGSQELRPLPLYEKHPSIRSVL